ncbi:MAG: hypothetical protein RSG51_00530 [Bacilli bacterium]
MNAKQINISNLPNSRNEYILVMDAVLNINNKATSIKRLFLYFLIRLLRNELIMIMKLKLMNVINIHISVLVIIPRISNTLPTKALDKKPKVYVIL